MWFNLQSTLTGERFQTLSRRIDRLQYLLRKTQDENEEDRHQDFQDFAHATGNGLNEVFRTDGSRAYPSPSVCRANLPMARCEERRCGTLLTYDFQPVRPIG